MQSLLRREDNIQKGWNVVKVGSHDLWSDLLCDVVCWWCPVCDDARSNPDGDDDLVVSESDPDRSFYQLQGLVSDI